MDRCTALDEILWREDQEFWQSLGHGKGDVLQSVIDYLPWDQSCPSIAAQVRKKLGTLVWRLSCVSTRFLTDFTIQPPNRSSVLSSIGWLHRKSGFNWDTLFGCRFHNCRTGMGTLLQKRPCSACRYCQLPPPSGWSPAVFFCRQMSSRPCFRSRYARAPISRLSGRFISTLPFHAAAGTQLSCAASQDWGLGQHGLFVTDYLSTLRLRGHTRTVDLEGKVRVAAW